MKKPVTAESDKGSWMPGLLLIALVVTVAWIFEPSLIRAWLRYMPQIRLSTTH